MVIFNVVSLFTGQPIRKSLYFLGRHIRNILALFCYIMTSPRFSFSGQFFKQINNRVVMRGLISYH